MKIFVFLLCLISAVANAAEWKHVGGNDNVIVQVDAQSITEMKSGDRKAWVEYMFLTPQNRRSISKDYWRTLELAVFNCSERTTGVLQQIYYARPDGGDIIDSVVMSPKNISMNDVIPETVGESQLKLVCQSSLKKK